MMHERSYDYYKPAYITLLHLRTYYKPFYIKVARNRNILNILQYRAILHKLSHYYTTNSGL
jgi:hypothetical protein